MAPGTRVRIQPPPAPLEIDTRAYRGALEVFGNSRRTLTVVNELPLEDYLRGVVPNELNPTTFGQLEALKAQAVAARTYIQRNLGQYNEEGYDICATDACQVYFGAKTEDPWRHRRSSIRAAWSQRTTGSRSTRSTAPPAAGAPRTPSTSSTRSPLPGLDELRAQAPEATGVHDDRDRFPTGRTACSRSRRVTNYRQRGAFRGARRAVNRHPPPPRPSRHSSGRRSIQRCSPHPTLVRQRAGDPAAGEAAPRRRVLFRLIDKNRVRVAAGRARRLRRRGDEVDGRRAAEGFTLNPDALIYQRIGDERPRAPGLLDRRRADRLPRRRRRDPDAGLPDQLCQPRGRPLFASWRSGRCGRPRRNSTPRSASLNDR